MKLHPKVDGETGRTSNEIWLSKLDVFELTILQMIRSCVGAARRRHRTC
ncbi:hypothetical protein COO91_03703 [Nostoc flagelliforme CCNUN1]|uniref:Uncharacterized protein n=1 Tax=Nostoc flagelliforme CCNUN1 TaxID=2038116 RepID=A0A2K8SQK6_9NOSO|nr:hypothetical protein COO91_03703 [Nostoc flagelliforme CCNUN1]